MPLHSPHLIMHQITVVLIWLLSFACSPVNAQDQCPPVGGEGRDRDAQQNWDYGRVFREVPGEAPGFTRSSVERDHALVTPESRVWGPLHGWTGTLTAHLISPTLLSGAKFSMYLAVLQPGARMEPPQGGVERLVVVLGGSLALSLPDSEHPHLGPGEFTYLPPGQRNVSCSAHRGAQLLVYEQLYQLGEPSDLQAHVGSIDAQPQLDVPGEVFRLRKLLPASPRHDFNVHVMDFWPGEYLENKEVHYNQHGLLLLQGEGIYRLGNHWYPVTAGDAIYMGPYCVQWFGALGTAQSRYILYKDTTVDPLHSSLGLTRCC